MENQETKKLSKKKMRIVIVVGIVVVLIVVYIIAALTGNLKSPEENDNTSSDTSSLLSSEENHITSLEFGEKDNFGIKEIGGEILSWVKLNTNDYDINDLEIVLVNPDIADVEFTNQSGKNQWYRIVAKKSGRTGFYIQTKDGTVRTETKVIVVDRTQEELDALND